MNLTFSKTWAVDGTLTAPDATPTLGVYDDTASAQVVTAGTAMSGSGGSYRYVFTGATAGHTYTATITVVYLGSTFTSQQVISAPAYVSSAQPFATSYSDLQLELAWDAFGLRPVSNVLTLDANQSADVDRCIRDGLQKCYYCGYQWSFLKPTIAIDLLAAYSTGTITVDGSGNVTLAGGTFPSYAASAFGELYLNAPVPPTYNSGSWRVQTYNSGTSIVLENYTGPVITAGVPFRLTFNRYPLPATIDSLQEDFWFHEGMNRGRTSISRTDEMTIRRELAGDNAPARPRSYALVTDFFDATLGSRRAVVFFPIPGVQQTLRAACTLRPIMLDSVNQYPIGGEVLSGAIMEGALAAAERLIRGMDEENPLAVHCRAFPKALAAAIQADKLRSAPDTLGVDHGHEGPMDGGVHRRLTEAIYWNASVNSGGYEGYL